VAMVAKKVPRHNGTSMDKSFVKNRLHSWQAHLSPYLQYREGVWWTQDAQVYRFHDSDSGPEYRFGPSLQYFRHTTLPEVHKHSSQVWQSILKSNTNLPTTEI